MEQQLIEISNQIEVVSTQVLTLHIATILLLTMIGFKLK